VNYCSSKCLGTPNWKKGSDYKTVITAKFSQGHDVPVIAARSLMKQTILEDLTVFIGDYSFLIFIF